MKKLVPLFVLLFALQSVSAQTKLAKPYKPPKIATSLGSYRDSASVTVAEMKKLISLPLAFSDASKGVYSVSSYQLFYRQKNVVEEEGTGRKQTFYTNVANGFKATPLPELWITSITEQVKPGEELLFFDVIVKDAQGRVMYAPNLKFTIR